MLKTYGKNLLALFVLACVIVVLGAVLSSCDTAHLISSNNPAFMHDYMFSVEPRNNGTYTIWVRNDDIGAYCTADAIIGESALKAVKTSDMDDIPVVISYRYRQQGDRETNGFSDGGCYNEGSKYSNVTVYKVLSLEVIHRQAQQPALYSGAQALLQMVFQPMFKQGTQKAS